MRDSSLRQTKLQNTSLEYFENNYTHGSVEGNQQEISQKTVGKQSENSQKTVRKQSENSQKTTGKQSENIFSAETPNREIHF